MNWQLRSFNDSGVAAFRDALDYLRRGETNNLPAGLLDDDNLSHRLGNTLMTPIRFSSKLNAAVYLEEKLGYTRNPDLLYDVGLWTWLAAFYFDQLCPDHKPGRDYRYVLEKDWRHYYRHLLAGPARVYAWHGASRAKVILSHPVHVHGEWAEQLTSRMEIASNRGIIEAADLLYWDESAGEPKKGAAPNRQAPGSLRRYVAVVQQFELTYDMFSMTGDSVLELLPQEFAG